MNGIIKKLVLERGFGFITPEGQAKDVFFHKDGLVGLIYEDLREGDAVSFDVEDSNKGPRAVNVQRA